MTLLRTLIFTSILAAVYFIVYYYLYKRFIAASKLAPRRHKAAKYILFALVYSSILPFFLFYTQGPLRDIVTWAAFVVFGFVFMLFPFSAARDLLMLFQNIIFKIYNVFVKPGSKNQPKSRAENRNSPGPNGSMSRLDFLRKSNVFLLGVTGVTWAYGFGQTRIPVNIVRREVALDGLPSYFDGFKIVQISDLHIGAVLKKPFMERVVEQVNSLSPDVVAITGDLVDGSVENIGSQTLPLKNLKPKTGSYFITGNHEYYSGVDEWIKELDRLGIKTLMNTHVSIKQPAKNKRGGNLVIAGVPDVREGKNFGHEYSPEKAIEGAAAEDIKILLAHQPLEIDRSVNAGYHLQLSGHTHGGQFFPWTIFVGLIYTYAKGLHLHNNKMWINVNPGTGFWGPPIRVGSPSEITLLTLRKGK